jgi:hypothetical protein
VALSAEDKQIKFPTNHYVGFQSRDGSGAPLGFMTPDGDDAAATKRKATVDTWAKGGYYGKTKTLPSKSFENKPMSGFKLGEDVRHGGGWGQGSVKWRIQDPRGFELEISSPNLAAILECSTIEKGEILDKCMWARLKNENILVPVTAELYQAAQSNSERLAKSASVKDLKAGNRIILLNGEEGIYMGAFYTLASGRTGHATPTWGDKKRFIYKSDTGHYEAVSNLKLSEIDDSVSADPKVLEKELNDFLSAPPKAGQDYYASRIMEPGHSYERIKGVRLESLKKSDPNDLTLELVQKTWDELKAATVIRHHYFETDTITHLLKYTDHRGNEVWAKFSVASACQRLKEYTDAVARHAATPHYGKPTMGTIWLELIHHEKIASENRLEIQQRTSRSYRGTPQMENDTVSVGADLVERPGVEFYVIALNTKVSDEAIQFFA